MIPDVLIVGAGIIGAACADSCARRGMRVLVLDQGQVAAETTSAGMGHVVVMDDSPAQFALTRFSRELWLRLVPELPPTIECRTAGTLWLAAEKSELEVVERKRDYFSRRGVACAVLSAGELRTREPTLRAGLAGGLIVPDDLIVDPPAVAQFLFERAKMSGAEFKSGAKVQDLLKGGILSLADGTRLKAGHVINAAGPWAGLLSPGLPIRKRKGHLILTREFPGLVRHQIVELGYLQGAHDPNADSVACNIQPRANGELIIVASRQFVDHREVDLSILQQMVARASRFVPGLSGVSCDRIRVGHRAATPDNLPIIGRSPEDPQLWFATGHEGLGITTSLATGHLLAELISGNTPTIPMESYACTRFAFG